MPAPMSGAGTYASWPSSPTMITRSSGAYYAVAIPVLFFGIIALLAGAAISQGVSSYNRGCAQIPNCMMQSDPSPGVYAIGAILLIVGVALILYGATRSGRSPDDEDS